MVGRSIDRFLAASECTYSQLLLFVHSVGAVYASVLVVASELVVAVSAVRLTLSIGGVVLLLLIPTIATFVVIVSRLVVVVSRLLLLLLLEVVVVAELVFLSQLVIAAFLSATTIATVATVAFTATSITAKVATSVSATVVIVVEPPIILIVAAIVVSTAAATAAVVVVVSTTTAASVVVVAVVGSSLVVEAVAVATTVTVIVVTTTVPESVIVLWSVCLCILSEGVLINLSLLEDLFSRDAFGLRIGDVIEEVVFLVDTLVFGLFSCIRAHLLDAHLLKLTQIELDCLRLLLLVKEPILHSRRRLHRDIWALLLLNGLHRYLLRRTHDGYWCFLRRYFLQRLDFRLLGDNLLRDNSLFWCILLLR